MEWKEKITSYEDWPKKGVTFHDISPIFEDPAALAKLSRDVHDAACWKLGELFDCIAAPEARGFLIGPILAERVKKPFVMIRKPGKLPKGRRIEYEKEYGKDILEVPHMTNLYGKRVLILDDLLATGGTSATCAKLIESCGGKVAGFVFMVELPELEGRKKINGYKIESLTTFGGK